MISNFKLAPNEIEKQIPQELYDRLKIRLEQIEKEEKKIRTKKLVELIPNLSQEKNGTFLEQYTSRFIYFQRILLHKTTHHTIHLSSLYIILYFTHEIHLLCNIRPFKSLKIFYKMIDLPSSTKLSFCKKMLTTLHFYTFLIIFLFFYVIPI